MKVVRLTLLLFLAFELGRVQNLLVDRVAYKSYETRTYAISTINIKQSLA